MPTIECQACGAEVRALLSEAGPRHCPDCGELLPAISTDRDRLTETVTEVARKVALPLRKRRAGRS